MVVFSCVFCCILGGWFWDRFLDVLGLFATVFRCLFWGVFEVVFGGFSGCFLVFSGGLCNY